MGYSFRLASSPELLPRQGVGDTGALLITLCVALADGRQALPHHLVLDTGSRVNTGELADQGIWSSHHSVSQRFDGRSAWSRTSAMFSV